MTIPEIKKIVQAAGGDYRGIQVGTARIPTAVLFNDPQTRTTLAIPFDQLTAGRVQKEIWKSRMKFAAQWNGAEQ